MNLLVIEREGSQALGLAYPPVKAGDDLELDYVFADAHGTPQTLGTPKITIMDTTGALLVDEVGGTLPAEYANKRCRYAYTVPAATPTQRLVVQWHVVANMRNKYSADITLPVSRQIT